MKPYTYLLIDFFTIIVCFTASFHGKIKFYKHFSAFAKAAIIVAIPFIAWDIWFTKTGVWWFNNSYTLGVNVFDLPLEEWLFFICIPFACIFTYYCLDKFFNLDWANKYNSYLVWVILMVCLLTIFMFTEKMYPLVTSLFTFSTVFYLNYLAKTEWFGKATFAFLILLPGFFMVNGVLTGTGLESPIVNYNSNEILNLRLFTIPVEDAFFGYSQFMLMVYFFNKFKKNKHEKL